MMRRIVCGALVTLSAAALSVGWFAQSGSAANSPAEKRSDDGGKSTKTVNILTLDAAQELAEAALEDCADKGFPVAVTVVDRGGVTLVVLRSEDATGATVAVTHGKASAAAGFQSPTAALNEAAKTNPGLISLPNFVILAGGLPIRIDGHVVGGVGVGGAPSGAIDDECAQTGLATLD